MAEVEEASPYLESPMEPEDVIYPCKGCGEILEEGKAFELAGNRWHIDCFRCNTCGTLLDSDANLLLLGDGSLICNNCTYSCNACGNKIEDLAILTGDQAFCGACFRCRNCKKKIENLRYARTSQGIFCMSCHEALMARRRKRSKTSKQSNGAVANGPAAAAKEKALPSLPPGAVPTSAFAPDANTTPLSDSQSGTSGALSPPEVYQSRRDLSSNNARMDVSPMSDDATIDGSTLPASTYGVRRPSPVSRASEDSEERGFLPMTFDPNPAPGPPPMARKEILRPQDPSRLVQNDTRSRDYFVRSDGKPLGREALGEDQTSPSSRSASTERAELKRSTSLAKASPHILFQDKARQKRPSVNYAPATDSTPAVGSSQDGNNRTKVQQLETGNLSVRSNDVFKLQDVPKSKRAGSRTSSKTESKSPTPNSPFDISPMEDEPVERIISHSPVSQDSGVNPFDDPKLRDGNGIGAPAPPKQADRPVRGDSLTPGTRKPKNSTPEMQSMTTANAQSQSKHERVGSASSVPSVFADAQSTLSRDDSKSRGVDDSPPERSSFDAPPPRASSRPMAPIRDGIKDELTSQSTTIPAGGHRKNQSLSSLRSSEAVFERGQISPTLHSAGLLKHGEDSTFSMEDEMTRIMRGDSKREATQAAMLRRVSNAIKHGRSFSGPGATSTGRSTSSNGTIEASPTVTISSPIFSSPSGKDGSEQLSMQLKRAQHRIAELQSQVSQLEDKLHNSSAEVKAANHELREKRTTMVVLDTQREMVVRELEVMTDHLAKAKDNDQPLDLTSLKNDVLKDFAQSLQKLKDQMTDQIENLVHKRGELTEEIGNLIQMKDKGAQEYEALTRQCTQLREMNAQILQNIQDVYKSNRGANGATGAQTANALGIYHPGVKIDSSGMPDVRNLVSADSSMPDYQNEAEPATILSAPQVVNIRKGQPKKFNWRKGGEKMAKNVTKGIKGAFASERKDGEAPYSIGMPYNQTMQAMGGSEQNSMMNGRQGIDGSRNAPPGGFGFFGQKNTGLKAQGLTNMKDNSSSNVAADASVLFGSELEARCEYEQRVVPSVIVKCIAEVESRGMDVEGIYRKSGGTGQVKQVQQGFEKDGNFDISDEDLDIHAVTSALKQYFRKLPTPLIPYDAYEGLLEAGRIGDKEKQILALRAAVGELPEHHRDCLEYLTQHLARVMAFEATNLMTTLNLAVVFAPTIMRPASIEREMSDMAAQRTALQALLEHNKTVFPEE